MSAEPNTCDKFLGGRIALWQPKNGYRAGIDPVLLAAATPASPGQSVLELGCGAGAASLCLAARVTGISLTGVEIQPEYAALARRNAVENSISFDVHEADLRDLPGPLRQLSFDHVIMNPPYYERCRSTGSQNPGRDIALGGETPVVDWIHIGAKRLKPKGVLTLIQRIDRLPDVLAALPKSLGSIRVVPIAARNGRAAHLFVLQARKNGRAAFRLSAPFVLHLGAEHLRDGNDYTPVTEAILRDGSALVIPD